MGSAPTPTERQTPTGIMLENGHPTLVTLSALPSISFWEKEVTPPGMDGGDEIDQTTMFNVAFTTSAPRKLKTMTEMSLTASYDPVVYTNLLAVINVKQTITVTYPDGSTEAFFGFVKNSEKDALVNGTQPSMTITIMPTNADPNDGTEQAPAYDDVSGT